MLQILQSFLHSLPAGRQGNDIGDVKFNSDGDGLGRYSVYQYQHTLAGGWEYNWIGEFGEKDNFRWDKINKTGIKSLDALVGIFRGELNVLVVIVSTFHNRSHCSAESDEQANKQDISSNYKQFGLIAIKSFSFKKR